MSYKVIIGLSSPVIIDPLSTFDGALAWCLVQDLKLKNTIKVVEDYDRYIDELLPLEKDKFGKDYIYKASSWFFDDGSPYAQFEVYVNKRFPLQRLSQYMPDFKNKIQGGSGENKDYRIPFYPVSVSHINFLFEGDKKKVEALLNKWLRGIGKKVSIGFGGVRSIDIEKVKDSPILFPDGEVRRPIPEEAAKTLKIKKGLERKAVTAYRPPYSPFHPERQKVCIIPDSQRMRGEKR